MKPVIIYIPVEDGGSVTLTKQQLNDIVQQAYEQGKKDGSGSPYYRDYIYSNTNSDLPITFTTTSSSGTIKNSTNSKGLKSLYEQRLE